MKTNPVAIGGLLATLLVAGCQLGGDSDSGRARGKPVVVLVSVSEASGASRDLTPTTPYSIPEYPVPLLQAGVEGYVDVRLGIGADGSVKSEAILKSTESDFESPVLSAVKTWQFPQLKRAKSDDDREVPIVCRIRFSIEESWRYSIGSEPSGSRDSNGGVMSAPSHSPTVSPR